MIRLLEDIGAAWRLIRLARTDTILDGPRARLRGPAAEIAACPWCASVWAAAAVLVLRWLQLGWLVRLLAVSAVAGEIAARLDE